MDGRTNRQAAEPEGTGRHGARLAALQQRMAAAGVDLVVLTPGTSWWYLTGVGLLASRLALFFVPRQGEPAWVVPRLEAERVARSPLATALALAPERVCTYADGDDPAPAVARAAADRKSVV